MDRWTDRFIGPNQRNSAASSLVMQLDPVAFRIQRR